MFYLYDLLVFNPLYNGLILLLDTIPFADAGVAVIVFTVIVKLILFPLSKKAITTQVRMKEVQPEIDALKEKYKSDRQMQALKVMEFYKTKKISPFASLPVLFIQLPILFALYSIFVNSGLPVVNESILYSFIKIPDISMSFFGLFDITQKSLVFSLLAGVSQYIQLHYSVGASATTAKLPLDPNKAPSMEESMQSMTKNMKYIFPVIIFFISYSISAVIAIYFTVSNLFTLAQELYIRKKLLSEVERP